MIKEKSFKNWYLVKIAGVGLMMAGMACDQKNSDQSTILKSTTIDSSPTASRFIEATVEPVKTPELEKKVIVIDPGHGFCTPGASSPDGKLQEDDITLEVANKVVEKLNNTEAYKAFLTRTSATDFENPVVDIDTDGKISLLECIQPRVKTINSRQAQLFLSIHFNGSNDPTQSGTETYYADQGPYVADSSRFAQLLQTNVIFEIKKIYPSIFDRKAKSDFGLKDYGSLYTLGQNNQLPEIGNSPAALLEIAFLSNSIDVNFIKMENSQELVSDGIVKAIKQYFETSTGENDQTPESIKSKFIERGGLDDPEVALTFDAGAGSEFTPIILETLQKENIQATMFITGKWAQDNPELIKQIVADGHEISNHSYSHLNFRELTDQEILTELTLTEKIISELTNQSTKPYFRPPFGAYNQHIIDLVSEAGWNQFVYWTFDSGDWRLDRTSQDVEKKVTSESSNGSIVVMHLNSQQEAEALPKIIANLKTKGLKPTTLTKVLKP